MFQHVYKLKTAIGKVTSVNLLIQRPLPFTSCLLFVCEYVDACEHKAECVYVYINLYVWMYVLKHECMCIWARMYVCLWGGGGQLP